MFVCLAGMAISLWSQTEKYTCYVHQIIFSWYETMEKHMEAAYFFTKWRKETYIKFVKIPYFNNVYINVCQVLF